MEVLLIEDYPSLGYVGDAITVKSGYARNFLVPKGIAVQVGSRRAQEMAHLLKGVSAKRAKLKGEAEEYGERVRSVKLEFDLKVGSQGKSFGSITTRDILAKLQERGYDLEKKQVRLAEPIKSAGTYSVAVQLHSEVVVEVSVEVTGIKQEKKEEEDGRGRRRKAKGASEEGAEDSETGDSEEASSNEESNTDDSEGADEADSSETAE